MQLTQTAKHMVNLPRAVKRLLVFVVDASLCVLTVWLAFYLRLGEWVALSGEHLWVVGASCALALPIFIASGLYRAIFRYAGWPALMAVIKAIAIYGALFASLFTFIGVSGIPRTVGLIQPVLLLLAVGASRALARYWLGGLYQSRLKRKALTKVLIYGAGAAGRELAAAMASSHEMKVVGFVDDDTALHGHVLNGVVIHSSADLPDLVRRLKVSHVLLTLPSATRQRRNEILNQMLTLPKVLVRTLPSVMELAQGKVSISDLRELDIEDVLGRDPVTPNASLLDKNIRGKVVLVTGAGGSIGSELCRQIIKVGPKVLLLVDHSEFALYELHQELSTGLAQATSPVGAGHARDSSLQSRAWPAPTNAIELVPLLASVRDGAHMRQIMAAYKPHTVYHAAAYKHVPLVEHNPVEGIKNNVLGTLTAAQAALDHGVADFVLISTDKAVRPTNIMGASKRLAEMVLQALATSSCGTQFSMVRFGNVLGSSGSVVPKFRQQIKAGGPITLTHADVTRYFMTIPEAAQLVIQAGAMTQGGDVFVLDMGESVKIIDLARRLVELSGLSVRDENNPAGDIAIEVTGLRPGEKLYEELLIGDNPQPTLHPRIMKAQEDFMPWPVLVGKLQVLERALEKNDVPAVRSVLAQWVSGYCPSGDVVDWVYVRQGGI